MTAYVGKGQPPVALGWGGIGSWWGSTPNYEGVQQTSVAQRQGTVYATGPTPVTIPSMSAPSPATGASDCPPGSRAIAIVIPRDIANGDPKR